MKRKKIFLVLCGLLFCTSYFVKAQGTYVYQSLSDFTDNVNRNKATSPTYVDIKGSPYLNEEFQTGEIFYSGKYRIDKIQLRYNLYVDNIEYKDKNVVMAFARPSMIDKVVIGDEVFMYIKEKEKKGDVSGFVKKWNDQFPSVVTKMKVEFFDKDPVKAFEEQKPARFERAYDMNFLMINEEELERIKSVKKLIQYIGDHQSELEKFAKKEKISSNKPKELAKLIDYYNSL